MTASPEDLFAFLNDHAIAHQTQWHDAVFTVEDSISIKGTLPGIHSKNLFLKDLSGAHILISAQSHTKIRLNQLHRHIGSRRLSFAAPEALVEMLGVTPGSVTAFALINDPTCKVRFIADAALFAADPVNFHPLINTGTTAISREDFKRFVAATGRPLEIVDFAALATAPG